MGVGGAAADGSRPHDSQGSLAAAAKQVEAEPASHSSECVLQLTCRRSRMALRCRGCTTMALLALLIICSNLGLMQSLTVARQGGHSLRGAAEQNNGTRAPSPSEPSFLLMVPGHSNPSRTDLMVRNIAYVARSMPSTVRFQCMIFLSAKVRNVSIPAPYECTMIQGEGSWTHFMKKVLSSSTYIAIMKDDVSLESVNMQTFLQTMERNQLGVAAPALLSWHWKVMMRDTTRRCAVRVTKFIDPLFTVFSRPAWECWQAQINTELNEVGWGMDATFHFTCRAKMGLLDEHTAARTYFQHDRDLSDAIPEEVAHSQLADWLATKAVEFNVTYGWDVDQNCGPEGEACAPPGRSSIKKHYMDYLRSITEAPTDCIAADTAKDE